MHNIIVYGSLRKGAYNYNAYKRAYKENLQYLETKEIEGYELRSLGSYPYIREGGGTLTVDLITCNEECFQSINNMELGAGYEAKEITIGDFTGTIYIMNDGPDTKIVKHGDWLKFLEQTELV